MDLAIIGKAPAEKFFGRGRDFEQYGLLVPENFKVIDGDGAEVLSELILAINGYKELWLHVTAGQSHVLAWSGTPIVAKLTPRERADGWAGEVAIVDVLQRTLVERPTWIVEKGTLHQTATRENDFMVTQGSFRDFELTVKVRPVPGGYAGVAQRITDLDAPDTGLYWVTAATPKGTKGYNNTWGLVRSADPGPTLVAKEWNELKTRAQGAKVTLTLNSEKCYDLDFPADEGVEGPIALATVNNRAEFGTLKILDLKTSKPVFEDTFAEGPFLADEAWRGGAQSVRIPARGQHRQRAGDIQRKTVPSQGPAAETLHRYRFLVVAQPCLSAKLAKTLQAWTDRAGTLIVLGNAGKYDELRRPSGQMLPWLGIKSLCWEVGIDRKLKAKISPAIHEAIAHVTPDGAEVVDSFDTGEPAILTRPSGKGKMVYFAHAPGGAFHTKGTRLEKSVALPTAPTRFRRRKSTS